MQIGTVVGCELCLCCGKLRLSSPDGGLCLGTLAGEFGRCKRNKNLTMAHARSAINCDSLNKAGDLGIDIDGLIGNES